MAAARGQGGAGRGRPSPAVPDDPATADIAVTVADDWHGRGAGSLLGSALTERRPAAGVAGDEADDDLTLIERSREQKLRIPGTISARRAVELEEAIWDRMHFASHLRQQRLGEFTIGSDLHRSEALALAQLLVLYQLVTARAVIALGGESARAKAQHLPEPASVQDPAPASPRTRAAATQDAR